MCLHLKMNKIGCFHDAGQGHGAVKQANVDEVDEVDEDIGVMDEQAHLSGAFPA
jgi:hypothetical protein